jgi:hypothetical protein
MFQQIKVWRVACVKCGKIFCSGDNTEDHFHTKKEAIEAIKDDGWWKIRNRKVYCDKCE